MAEDYAEAEVEEEFSVWKKNTPLLYDLFVSHPLPWPSLTVHWLPSSPQPHSNPSFNLHKLLLATHTAEGEPNLLMLAHASLPVNTSQPIISDDPQNPLLPKVNRIGSGYKPKPLGIHFVNVRNDGGWNGR